MNINWIEINLPWRVFHNFTIPYPDLSDKGRQIFGKSSVEARQDFNQKFLNSYKKIENEVEDRLSNVLNLEEMDDTEYKTTINQIWEFYKDEPAVVAKNELKEFIKAVDEWLDIQPEMIEYHKRWNELKALEDLKSFVGRGLDRPGTLIELENGKREFIGTINTLRGVCDDCVAFENNIIVKRYAVIADLTNEFKSLK